VSEDVALRHISFGSVLGEDGKPLSTSKGTGSLLEELLNEAVMQASRVYEENRKSRLERGEEVPELSPAERQTLDEAVGVGAVKYADLSQNRLSDYRFSLTKMTRTDGNTATYMQYAYVRTRGIMRKGEIDPIRFRTDPPQPALGTSQERELGLMLVRFEEALDRAAQDYQPSDITAYLWDLANTFTGFFVNCPVLKAESAELRESRLLLCDLTGRVIQKGLDLLGIKTPERM
jgi:arginyl-tRNA synthetase